MYINSVFRFTLFKGKSCKNCDVDFSSIMNSIKTRLYLCLFKNNMTEGFSTSPTENYLSFIVLSSEYKLKLFLRITLIQSNEICSLVVSVLDDRWTAHEFEPQIRRLFFPHFWYFFWYFFAENYYILHTFTTNRVQIAKSDNSCSIFENRLIFWRPEMTNPEIEKLNYGRQT